MKAHGDGDTLHLQAEDADEARVLQALALTARRTGFILRAAAPGTMRLELGRPMPHPLTVLGRELVQGLTRHGMDWLAAVSLATLSVWTARGARAASPDLWLGLGGLLGFTLASTVALLSWWGHRPGKGTPRLMVWVYWTGAAWLLLAAGAITVGMLGWLGLTLGALLRRLGP